MFRNLTLERLGINSFEFILLGGLLTFLNLQLYFIYICMYVCYCHVWEVSAFISSNALSALYSFFSGNSEMQMLDTLLSSPKSLGRRLCFTSFLV